MRHRKGFTLIEVLLVLLLIPLILTLTLSAFRLFSDYDYKFIERQNFLATIQLRKRVALGSQITLISNRLKMSYRNSTIELICEEDRVVEYEGTLIYLTHLEDCSWQIDGKLIFLHYRIDQHSTKVFIGYVT